MKKYKRKKDQNPRNKEFERKFFPLRRKNIYLNRNCQRKNFICDYPFLSFFTRFFFHTFRYPMHNVVSVLSKIIFLQFVYIFSSHLLDSIKNEILFILHLVLYHNNPPFFDFRSINVFSFFFFLFF